MLQGLHTENKHPNLKKKERLVIHEYRTKKK